MKGNQAQGEQDSTEPKDNKRKVRTKREKRTPVNRREYGSGGGVVVCGCVEACSGV